MRKKKSAQCLAQIKKSKQRGEKNNIAAFYCFAHSSLQVFVLCHSSRADTRISEIHGLTQWNLSSSPATTTAQFDKGTVN